jgi:hypothetical protein
VWSIHATAGSIRIGEGTTNPEGVVQFEAPAGSVSVTLRGPMLSGAATVAVSPGAIATVTVHAQNVQAH